jgi:hypothetical protein
MPETVFYFAQGTEEKNKKLTEVLHSSFIQLLLFFKEAL